jgi:protocatechuate 4,5-dioxygenase, alpha chain
MTDNPFDDIPGTTLFDARQSRLGFHLNQFCMSLMKAENRAAFKADERAYLDRWKMTEAQKQAVLERDWNGMIALGGNIYLSISPPRSRRPTASHSARSRRR